MYAGSAYQRSDDSNCYRKALKAVAFPSRKRSFNTFLEGMWVKISLLLLVVSFGYGAIMRMKAEVGKPVELSVGKVVKWKRNRNGVEEFIKYCDPKTKEPICSQFVTKDNKPSNPVTKAHVKKDGTLVIESVKASDRGLYSSPDQKPTRGVAPPHIQLEV
ncbi:unnamed protein product [Cylicocyclus nassatus]|uniref:Uncharacterized protein n=1 Tax=Cylicocyclus nassatus TaxID=53992 RepID=A0AA36H2S9_CYLNA|nr:unnamed protein product [Cylicocyclus nassatus]